MGLVKIGFRVNWITYENQRRLGIALPGLEDPPNGCAENPSESNGRKILALYERMEIMDKLCARNLPPNARALGGRNIFCEDKWSHWKKNSLLEGSASAHTFGVRM